MKDCAPQAPIALWRARVLAFVGRFFPVPVQPVFSQRGEVGYGSVGGYGAGDGAGDNSGGGNCAPSLNAPCN